MQTSGKLVIIGILAVALASAAVSWWFRYSATHRAAEFWGPETARLIRDAPAVGLIQLRPATAAEQTTPPASYLNLGGDPVYVPDGRWVVTGARGLLHMRNALLEDRSYDWSARETIPGHDEITWKWVLVFMNAGGGTMLEFSADCDYISQHGRVISCLPIAAGLRTMFDEFAAESPASPAASPNQPLELVP